MSTVDPVLSLSLQHVFAGERLQAFSDAVFAIIATFMVRLARQSLVGVCRDRVYVVK